MILSEENIFPEEITNAWDQPCAASQTLPPLSGPPEIQLKKNYETHH